MTSASQSPTRRPSAATLVLLLAALIALVSAGFAISRSFSRDRAAADSPAAKDWRVVGWAYAQAGRPGESAAAYRKAAAMEPGNAENWSSLGEALQVPSATLVPEARAAFAKALELEPRDPRARYFLAVQKDLAGDHRGAVDGWLDLLRDTPSGAPWESDLRQTIARTAAKHGIEVASRIRPPTAARPAQAGSGPGGPTPEQVAALSALPPEQQAAMVEQMVARLESRLKSSPKDEDGWVRLIRSSGAGRASLRARRLRRRSRRRGPAEERGGGIGGPCRPLTAEAHIVP
jgi:cytochrome c-type biogenesis protein CcmH